MSEEIVMANGSTIEYGVGEGDELHGFHIDDGNLETYSGDTEAYTVDPDNRTYEASFQIDVDTEEEIEKINRIMFHRARMREQAEDYYDGDTDDVTDAIDRVETEDMSFKYVCPKDDCNGSVSMGVDYDEYVYRECPGCGDDITMVKA